MSTFYSDFSCPLVRSCAPYDEVPVTAYRWHPSFDLTVLQTTVRSRAVLRKSAAVVPDGDPVTVMGFPNWHSFGHQPLKANTHVVQQRTIGGSSLASVGYPLLAGTSGGPVLNSEGRVTGVVVNSGTSAVFPNSFLAIGHLDAVVAAPLKAV